MLPLVFHWFAWVAAGMSAIQLTTALTRTPPPEAPAALIQTARQAAVVQHGGFALVFLIVGIFQTVGHFKTPFYLLAPTATSPYILPARIALFAFWGTCLWSIWRPGVAEAVIALGYVRATWSITPAQLRQLTTLTLALAALSLAVAPYFVPIEIAQGSFLTP